MLAGRITSHETPIRVRISPDLQLLYLRVGGYGELEERLLSVDPLGHALQLGEFPAQGPHVGHVHGHVVHVAQVVQLANTILQLLDVRDEGFRSLC